MNRAQMLGVIGSVFTCLAWCGYAQAEQGSVAGRTGTDTESRDQKLLAKRSYADAVRYYASGDLERSLSCFERAYELAPHYQVLFNIGQIHSELGQPLEAVEALRRYLEQSKGKADAERVREAQRVLAASERRIGRLQVNVEPGDASVLLDGRKLPAGAAEFSLVQGAHVIVATREGFTPKTETVRVVGAERQSVEIQLTPAPVGARRPNGWLTTTCAVPGVSVRIDDLAPTNLAGERRDFSLESGQHRVRFERPGYDGTQFEVELENARTKSLDCGLTPPRVVPSELRAKVVIEAASDEIVSVDGTPFRRDELPIGPHRVQVLRRNGFAWTKDIELRQGQTLKLRTDTDPKSVQSRSSRQAVSTQRTFTHVLGGVGLAAIAGSAVAFGLSEQRYSNWERERDSLSPSSSNVAWRQASEHASEVRFLDGLSIGLGIGGAVILASSIYLWISDSTEQ